MRSCFRSFFYSHCSGEASAMTLFKGIVFQEISPDEWLRALEEKAARGRVTPTCKFRSLRRFGRPLRMQRKRLQRGMWRSCVSAQSLRAFHFSSIMRWHSRRTVVRTHRSCLDEVNDTSIPSRHHAGLVGGYARSNGSFWPFTT